MTNLVVKEIKPRMGKIEDIKPRMGNIGKQVEKVYYDPEVTLSVGQSMGLLLALTYAEEHKHTPVRK